MSAMATGRGVAAATWRRRPWQQQGGRPHVVALILDPWQQHRAPYTFRTWHHQLRHYLE